ncbi:MAG: ABC transporter permease subunit [Oscillospiraceae bacterium]
MDNVLSKVKNKPQRKSKNYIKKNMALYIMLIPGMLSLILFKYVPMYGILMSFQNFRIRDGIWGSKWVGLEHFVNFFNDPFCGRLIGNTFLLGILTILFTFPAPIILALMFNEIKHDKFKRVTQTISYMPYFISMVVVVGLLKEFTSVDGGIVNSIIQNLGFEPINFFAQPGWFRPLYIITGIWTGVGYGSIVYLAAISGVNPELYESAVLEGATRLKQIWYITLPSITPTIMVMFIFAVGGILGTDYQKVLLMQSPLTYETSDIISTYIYRLGIEGGSYSYTSAINLFSSAISLVFILGTNWLSRKLTDSSLY